MGDLQASFKQNFIREEKNREEKKKKDDVNIIQRNIGIGGTTLLFLLN